MQVIECINGHHIGHHSVSHTHMHNYHTNLPNDGHKLTHCQLFWDQELCLVEYREILFLAIALHNDLWVDG